MLGRTPDSLHSAAGTPSRHCCLHASFPLLLLLPAGGLSCAASPPVSGGWRCCCTASHPVWVRLALRRCSTSRSHWRGSSARCRSGELLLAESHQDSSRVSKSSAHVHIDIWHRWTPTGICRCLRRHFADARQAVSGTDVRYNRCLASVSSDALHGLLLAHSQPALAYTGQTAVGVLGRCQSATKYTPNTPSMLSL